MSLQLGRERPRSAPETLSHFTFFYVKAAMTVRRTNSPRKSIEPDFALAATESRFVDVGGQMLHIGIRAVDSRVPPLIFNGLGANLELVEPLGVALTGIESVVFDVPGIGGSPAPKLPYFLWQMARLDDCR